MLPGARVFNIHTCILPQSEHARVTSLQLSWTPLTWLINVRVAKKCGGGAPYANITVVPYKRTAVELIY